MIKFSRANQVKILKVLIPLWENIINRPGDNGMTLLLSLWDLQKMPSQDVRFTSAFDDIRQHYINNSDWTTEHLFVERLQVYKDDQKFKLLIEEVIDPKHYTDNGQLTAISVDLQGPLDKDGLRLVVEDYSESGLPFYKVYEQDEILNLPPDIKKNNIVFYVMKEQYFDVPKASHFVLNPNTVWNDYSVVSYFGLSYINESGLKTQIGSVKIIHENELKTWQVLPDTFTQLSTQFCSLSENADYYEKLLKIFDYKGMISVLNALQDAAFFTHIHDKYSRNSNFINSLIRNDRAERILRTIKPVISGSDLEDLFGFSYHFKPAFSKTPLKVTFDFHNKEPMPNRIIAVIGKNGTGKTQLLTTLPIAYSEQIQETFFNKIPSFSKLIAVSYSVFDTFKIPRPNAMFNYVYCGLKNEKGDMRSNSSMLYSFHADSSKILAMNRYQRWRSALLNFIDKELLDALLIIIEIKEPENRKSVDRNSFNALRDRLSSGQSILLYIITAVVANIRFDSLILYDEPETHLHPNAIVQLMNTIYQLVNEFESFCLIATHSPIVIRELLSKNVFVMEREKNVPTMKRIGLESFGENLGVLNDEVFGDRQMPKQYKKIIDEFIQSGKTFQEIVTLLEFDEYPLSLNVRIYIKMMTTNEK